MDLTRCLEPIETTEGLFLPCQREHGHPGEHSPGRCGAEIRGEGTGLFAVRGCSRPRGHSGEHWSWVEEADAEREYESEPKRDEESYNVRSW